MTMGLAIAVWQPVRGKHGEIDRLPEPGPARDGLAVLEKTTDREDWFVEEVEVQQEMRLQVAMKGKPEVVVVVDVVDIVAAQEVVAVDTEQVVVDIEGVVAVVHIEAVAAGREPAGVAGPGQVVGTVAADTVAVGVVAAVVGAEEVPVPELLAVGS